MRHRAKFLLDLIVAIVALLFFGGLWANSRVCLRFALTSFWIHLSLVVYVYLLHVFFFSYEMRCCLSLCWDFTSLLYCALMYGKNSQFILSFFAFVIFELGPTPLSCELLGDAMADNIGDACICGPDLDGRLLLGQPWPLLPFCFLPISRLDLVWSSASVPFPCSCFLHLFLTCFCSSASS